MSNIQTLSFPQRSDALSTYCPFCGAHSFDGEHVTQCEHLQLVYVSIADVPFQFIAVPHQSILNDYDDVDEVLNIISQTSPQGAYVALHEVEAGAAPYETVILYDSMD